MGLKYYPMRTMEDLLNELDKVPLKKANVIVKERHFSRNEPRVLKIYYAQRSIREAIPFIVAGEVMAIIDEALEKGEKKFV